ncbi:two component transcriptional regulator, LytTR family [Filimonas lacunae]|uniref:Two component transcriptional regulator, LytTR family n=1 Tax=Filimonas lacunae TaxID=477680 RepID=A0A173MJH8_9BACT|nr:LytTR family DNA-binding domain-containing protein [Filimonas lacunae]BAV07548.1 two-component system response regulator [Filimonas lacunae]SIT29993.1 two component transcriptional regulator, LytTR family [Filimonas lacunae]
MNIVIIEDERVVAEDLEINLRKLIQEPLQVVQLGSVQEAIPYLNGRNDIDVIFSDIQLGDGLSFEIFIAVAHAIPVIFCTAYDEYALDAFKVNGIDYILKPFTSQILEKALNRYYQLKKAFARDQVPAYHSLIQLLQDKGRKASSVLVYHQDRIIPVKFAEVAIAYLANDIIHLHTFHGKVYYPNKSLDELEKLGGSEYFRVNRQFLVHRNVITDVSSFFSRRLSLNLTIAFPERITVSKARVAPFLEWLANS